MRHPSVTDSVASIFLQGFSEETSPGRQISVRSLFFIKHAQIMYAGYVKVAPGKPQTGRVKFKISPGTGEAKFSLGEGKNPLG